MLSPDLANFAEAKLRLGLEGIITKKRFYIKRFYGAVKILAPSFVTAIVYSKCADSDPSFVAYP